MEFISGAVTEQCSDRSHVNQDKYGAVEVNNIITAVVSDGVSRSYRSEVASYNTVLYVLLWASEYFKNHSFDPDAVIEQLDRRLKHCNSRINDFSEKFGQGEYSCCTVSGIVTDGKNMVVFNAGDSRIYEINVQDEKLYLLTEDNKAPDGHKISMCMGAFDNDEMRITYTKEPFEEHSVYILCTDGMYQRSNFKKWGKHLFGASDRRAMEGFLHQMMCEVRDAGEEDDVTAIAFIRNFKER